MPTFNGLIVFVIHIKIISICCLTNCKRAEENITNTVMVAMPPIVFYRQNFNRAIGDVRRVIETVFGGDYSTIK